MLPYMVVLYICESVCIYIYIYVYIYIYIYMYIYIYIYMYTHTDVCINVYIYTSHIVQYTLQVSTGCGIDTYHPICDMRGVSNVGCRPNNYPISLTAAVHLRLSYIG